MDEGYLVTSMQRENLKSYLADEVSKIIQDKVEAVEECKLSQTLQRGCFSIFYNLKNLKLMPGVDKCHIQVIIILLKCSPNLEALLIEFVEMSEWENYWKSQDEDVTCLAYHLKTVEISNCEGQENELEFVKFLLKNGRVLEKMTIFLSTDLEEQMKITQKVLAFPKASSSVAISFPKDNKTTSLF
ncbi:hypothetical protein HHK36_028092 [Tetracentron sinense]|uniref:FBD domain-containing protein n=1 Tax=Tetracentron sinense TaxID=13715 RepID=A0A834YIU3_TETSI|nr:hypothetical protein HHK36_028092 [Tetracentron sinense]